MSNTDKKTIPIHLRDGEKTACGKSLPAQGEPPTVLHTASKADVTCRACLKSHEFKEPGAPLVHYVDEKGGRGPPEETWCGRRRW